VRGAASSTWEGMGMTLEEDVATRPLPSGIKQHITYMAILQAEYEGAITKEDAKELRELL